MKDDYEAYTISHDEADFPTYTHDAMITKNKWEGYQIVGIIESNKEHISLLSKWNFKEVDVESRYWLHDGQLGGHYRVFDGPKSRIFEYIFKLSIKQAKLILDNPEKIIGICNKSGAFHFLGKSYSTDDLEKFMVTKINIDNLENPPKYWKVG